MSGGRMGAQQAACLGRHDYVETSAGRARCTRCGVGLPGTFDADLFVDSWLSSTSIREVAEKTGLSDGTVVCYGSMLRRIGVDLPRMNRATPINARALNTRIREARKGARKP